METTFLQTEQTPTLKRYEQEANRQAQARERLLLGVAGASSSALR